MPVYDYILAIQHPFAFSVDELNRVMYSVNFRCRLRTATSSLRTDIANYIIANGLGTALGTDIFASLGSNIPSGAGPFIQVLNNAGGQPTYEAHDGNSFELPSFQVIVRGANDLTVETRVLAIWRLLDKKRNLTLT